MTYDIKQLNGPPVTFIERRPTRGTEGAVIVVDTPSDLLILDHDPEDPFDFNLDRYLDQLVAGYSRNTPWGGLVAVMPDFDEMQDAGRTRKDPGAARAVWASR